MEETSPQTLSQVVEPLTSNTFNFLRRRLIFSRRFDNLRDQLQETDEFKYTYDNTTTKVDIVIVNGRINPTTFRNAMI